MRASTLGDRLKKINDNNADFAYDISSMMNDSVDKTKKIVRGLYPSNLKNSFVSEFNELINTLNNFEKIHKFLVNLSAKKSGDPHISFESNI